MNKKFYALMALLLAASLLLCGCGQSQESVSGSLSSTKTPEKEPLEMAEKEEIDAPAEDPVEEPVEEPAEEPVEEPAEEPVETEKPVTMGRMEGGVYTNEYVGFACELDESWSFYGAEELQTLPENVAAVLEGSEVGDAIAELEQFTDMMAENQDMLCTVNVLYQKLGLQEQMAYALLSEGDVIDLTLENKDLLSESYALAGMDITDIDKKTVTFLGEERTALYSTGSTQGLPIYTLQLFYYNSGSYSVTVTFTSFMEDNTDAVMALFRPLAD